MFPLDATVLEKEIKIQNTMRLMPEDMNTGGFYVALLKKTGTIRFRKSTVSSGKLQTNLDEKNGSESPSKVAAESGETKETQKVKLNEGEVVANVEAAPHAEVDKKRKDRSIKSEYYELPAKHEDVWLSIKEMYGLDDVTIT